MTTGGRILLWAAVVLVVTVFLYSVRAILLPFVIAIVAAALLEPSIRKLRLRGFSRGAAIWVVFLSFFVITGAIGVLLAPRVVSQVRDLRTSATGFLYDSVLPGHLVRFLSDTKVNKRMDAQNVPTETNTFLRWMKDDSFESAHTSFFVEFSDDLMRYDVPRTRTQLLADEQSLTRPGFLDEMLANNRELLERANLPTTAQEAEQRFQVRSKLESFVQGFVDSALGGAATIVQYLLSSLFLLILTPIITLFMLFEFDKARRRFVTWIPPTIRPGATEFLGDIGDVLSSYFRGLVVSVSLYTTIVALLFFLLGVPYALFLALLCGVFYIVPYFGNLISMGVLFLTVVASDRMGVGPLQFGSTATYAIFCMGVFFVFGLLYDQLVHPRIVGRAVGLSPVTSFFVVLCGYATLGLAGMLFAFPIAGIIKVVLDRLIKFTTTTETEEIVLPRIPSRHAT